MLVAFMSFGMLTAHAAGTDLGGNPPAASTDLGGNPPSGAASGNLLVNPLKSIDSLPELLQALLGGLVEIGTIVLILALVWVGFSFVRAQGKPEELKKARSALVWTIIGGGILLGAQAISNLIQSTVSSL